LCRFGHLPGDRRCSQGNRPTLQGWLPCRFRLMAKTFRAVVAALAFAIVCMPVPARAYSVLAHEANIDALWEGTISKMLVARFPGATPEELLEARAYAYGGCVIQDLGYYPFGSRFFS